MKSCLILATVLVVLLLNFPAAFGQRDRPIFGRPNGGRSSASSRSRANVGSGRNGPSKSQAENFARSNSAPKSSLVQKAQAAYAPPTCSCDQYFCKSTIVTHNYIIDNNDECYIYHPHGGIKEKWCSDNTHDQPCSDVLKCGCGGGRCKDVGSKWVYVVAVCKTGYGYRLVAKNVELYDGCCCE